MKSHVRSADLFLRADLSGRSVQIYKVPGPAQDQEIVPVYFSQSAYDDELGHLGPALVLKGEEVLRLTSGLGIGFNIGRDPVVVWAADYADDVRSEWAANGPS